MADTNGVQKSITWQDIEPLIFNVKYKEFFKNLDTKIFELVLDENSKPKVVESVLKVLRERDPQNATNEHAEEIIELMKKIALQITAHDKVNEENRVFKSVLMGAPQVTNAELVELGIEITQEAESGTRKLLIPAKSLELYKALVRAKLDNGFWNDFVGDDLIYFIFKMPDGEIKEFVYDEEDRLTIAELCSQLNHDPIEKTSDLLNYMAENEFYTEAVEKYKRKL